MLPMINPVDPAGINAELAMKETFGNQANSHIYMGGDHVVEVKEIYAI